MFSRGLRLVTDERTFSRTAFVRSRAFSKLRTIGVSLAP